jgi:hypothetical protein
MRASAALIDRPRELHDGTRAAEAGAAIADRSAMPNSLTEWPAGLVNRPSAERNSL